MRKFSIAIVAMLIIGFVTMAYYPVSAATYTEEQILNQVRGVPGATKKAVMLTIGGNDGTNNRVLKTDTGGELQVDVLTMPAVIVTGVSTETTLAAMSAKLPESLGTKTAAASFSVTYASDGTLPLPTGAATAALQTTGNTSLSTLAGAVAGSEMQVDIVSSALPSGAATEATVATLAGAVAEGHVQADIVGALPAGTNTIGKVGGGDTLTVTGSVASGGNLLAAATGTKKHRIYKIIIASDTGAGTMTLSDGCGTYYVPAAGYSFDFNPVGVLQGTADTAITCTMSAGGNFFATVIYKDE